MNHHQLAPIAIGGVGGSGTRLIAELISRFGYYIGSDLNEASDNLWFTLLFKHLDILSYSDEKFSGLYSLFARKMAGKHDITESELSELTKLASLNRSLHSSTWLNERVASLASDEQHGTQIKQWSWKEPNTHVLLDRLNQCSDHLKYIHVMRNGLEMAHSTNQNQLRLWGPHFLGTQQGLTTFHALKFWCVVHRRISLIGNSMGDRFLMVNYNSLCDNPSEELQRITRFVNSDSSAETISALAELVKPSPRTKLHTDYNLDSFDPEDLNYVRSMGFQIAND